MGSFICVVALICDRWKRYIFGINFPRKCDKTENNVVLVLSVLCTIVLWVSQATNGYTHSRYTYTWAYIYIYYTLDKPLFMALQKFSWSWTKKNKIMQRYASRILKIVAVFMFEEKCLFHGFYPRIIQDTI